MLFLMGGFIPAMVLGIPLGLLTAWPLKMVRRQWIHVVVHAVVTGLVAGWLLGWGFSSGALLVGLAAAVSAAVGRLSVVKLVAARNSPAAR